jgi:hypothetical protein
MRIVAAQLLLAGQAGTLIAVPDDDASGRSHELAAFG